ncbi:MULTISPECIES: hypothetical protein [unclassified Streptomyces]|uniref:hypothetical protein n=1 Tax=unclassified Streptomyces TaxID=2593676 RepID=UPI00225B75D3|nr:MULTISPECIES: hypothetical protein [unclassified Streptomyces]MCX4865703.1 hypothetical protein [Streptomyces sp. NBC_00906]MCX4896942.1 hypothetical protein [Streptomyces sp. NBC_00892]
MDAGLAAVFGALAGSAGTIGAAFATGWAQRSATRITVRAEHVRQRNQPRREAYIEFMTIAREAMEHTISALAFTEMDPGTITEQRLDELRDLLVTLDNRRLMVAFAGPPSIGNKGQQVFEDCRHLYHELRNIADTVGAENQQMELATRLARQVTVSDDFFFHGGEILDEDGGVR